MNPTTCDETDSLSLTRALGVQTLGHDCFHLRFSLEDSGETFSSSLCVIDERCKVGIPRPTKVSVQTVYNGWNPLL